MSFHCDFCNLSVNSQEQFNQHCTGSKHRNNAARAKDPNYTQNKIDQIKASGKSYFVKAENSAQALQSQQISTSAESNAVVPFQTSSDHFCSTCRVTLTSAVQAQMHYSGSKHRLKLQMLEPEHVIVNDELKNQGGNNGSQAPVFFCEVCHIRFTSSAQAEVHYAGTKHAQKCRQAEEMRHASQNPQPGNLQMPEEDVNNSSTFCHTCRIQFTSPIQAQMHYQGAKHKNTLKLVHDKKSGFPPAPTPQQEDGEPSAKKPKFLQTCETCNVKLTCPESAATHFSGSKHAKKLALLKQFEEGTLPKNVPGQARNPNKSVRSYSNPGFPRPSGGQAGTEGNKGGHLYCSFCDVSMNSQSQMDAHRSGSKHKARVEGGPKPQPNMMAATVIQNFSRQEMTTAFYPAMGNQQSGAYPSGGGGQAGSSSFHQSAMAGPNGAYSNPNGPGDQMMQQSGFPASYQSYGDGGQDFNNSYTYPQVY